MWILENCRVVPLGYLCSRSEVRVGRLSLTERTRLSYMAQRERGLVLFRGPTRLLQSPP